MTQILSGNSVTAAVQHRGKGKTIVIGGGFGGLAANTSHLRPKGERRDRKLRIWHATSKKNLQGAFQVQMTPDG